METSIAVVREHLDAWERRTGNQARLQGFSAHYNISVPAGHAARPRRLQDLSWLLAHILPAPVMLLGTNRRSTGVGVRPRPNRLEVTADFPPDPARFAATGSLVAGIVTEVMKWRDLRVERLTARGIPTVRGFRPTKHTSRRGWVARGECFPADPFSCGPDAQLWDTTRGPLTLRQMALTVFSAFRPQIRRMADEFSYRTVRAVLSGSTRSWLDDVSRPRAYDDVGRGTSLPIALTRLGLDQYERVMLNAIEARPLQIGDDRWVPVGVRGWSRVVFRRDGDGARTVLPLDTLVRHLGSWESGKGRPS
jgi:hypothetical protein